MRTNNKHREALELASRVIHGAIAADILKGDDAQTAFFACRAALAEPIRNCEVGTVEEQIKRFYDEYYAKHSKCKRRWSFGECAIHWSQMPYEGVKG